MTDAPEPAPRWTIGNTYSPASGINAVAVYDADGMRVAQFYGPSPEVCLARANAFVQAQQGWRPIEEAPDTTSVIVCVPRRTQGQPPIVGEAYRRGRSWWWAQEGREDYHAREIYPTLWQPLPSPPTEKSDAGKA